MQDIRRIPFVSQRFLDGPLCMQRSCRRSFGTTIGTQFQQFAAQVPHLLVMAAAAGPIPRPYPQALCPQPDCEAAFALGPAA